MKRNTISRVVLVLLAALVCLGTVAYALDQASAPSGVASPPVASGVKTAKNDKAVIDYSNTKDGYVMVQYTASATQRLKVQVVGPNSTTYTYDLPAQAWTTFPLSEGNGSYKVTVFSESSPGSGKYATVLSASVSVTLSDEFAPFLRPNQYVEYSGAKNSVAKAAELTKGLTDPMAKLEKIYNFVTETLTYDTKKAATVQSGYLPVLDDVLANKTGICFDYAALMTGMLRSQGIPCKLVVGYVSTPTGQAYHAWISVWTEGSGWIDSAIYFDGTDWHRMDPTFASSNNNSDSILQYIGDGSHYSVKYLY